MSGKAETAATVPAHVTGTAATNTTSGVAGYLVLGLFLGIVFTKAEVTSWFRIQEMFRFQSFHMYGIIGSAVLVSGILIRVIRHLQWRSFSGEMIVIPSKRLGHGVRYVVGGLLFGIGWALTGTCPGPMFALIGGGSGVMIVVLGSAIVGTWFYGTVRHALPH